MISIIIQLAFGIAGLGIIVFIHELGHFIAAKLSHIEVEIFSLGWGKKLIGFKYKGTQYQIAWFPLGGFCKMKGEMLSPDMTEEKARELRQEKGSFLSASPWKRIFVSCAGPFANFIFAILLYTVIQFIGYDIYTSDNRIVVPGEYDAQFAQSPAYQAGLQSGDRILAIENVKTENFDQISRLVKSRPQKSIILTVEREKDGVTNTFPVDLTTSKTYVTQEGMIGIENWVTPVISYIKYGSPAQRAGIQVNDVILKLNGTSVLNSADMRRIISDKPDILYITLQRQSTVLEKTINVKDHYSHNTLKIGIDFKSLKTHSPQYNLPQAFTSALKFFVDIPQITVRGIAYIFIAKQKTKVYDVVSGPARVIQIVGEQAESNLQYGLGQSLVEFFRFICLLSIFIAFMNLLPIPALDGGMAVVSFIEGLRRKPLALKILFRIQFAGFVIIAMLILLAVTSDIMYYFFSK